MTWNVVKWVDGLAHTEQAVDRVRRSWQQALDIYAELDLPEAAGVRAHLRAIAGGAPPGPLAR